MIYSLRTMLCLFTTFLFSFTLVGQETVMQMVTLTPKKGALKELSAAMKKHNDAFHPDGTFGARAYAINSGTDVGKIIWVLGPVTWANLDNRPGEGAHDDDWDEVMQHVENIDNVEYFRLDTKRSFFNNDFDLKYLRIRYVDVRPQKMYRYNVLQSKIQEVYAAKLPNQPRGLYRNTMGDSKDGKDIMIAWFFDEMAWMGDNVQFRKKYEEVHGPGSWMDFMNEIEDVVKSSNTMLVSHLPEMGGAGKTISRRTTSN